MHSKSSPTEQVLEWANGALDLGLSSNRDARSTVLRPLGLAHPAPPPYTHQDQLYRAVKMRCLLSQVLQLVRDMTRSPTLLNLGLALTSALDQARERRKVSLPGLHQQS